MPSWSDSWNTIKFITHLHGSDSVVSFVDMQGVFLIVECKHKTPPNSIWAFTVYFGSYHFALSGSKKTNHNQTKGLWLKQIFTVHSTVSLVSKESRKGGSLMFKTLDRDRIYQFKRWPVVTWSVVLLSNTIDVRLHVNSAKTKSSDLLEPFSPSPSSTPTPVQVTLRTELFFFNTKHFWFATDQMRYSLKHGFLSQPSVTSIGIVRAL